MAVLIEAISVVIRRETIAEKYLGGLDQYIDDCPNNTLCMDEEIVRVGFMTGEDAKAFVDNLESRGFRLATDGHLDEIALVDQFEGFAMPCDWLELRDVTIFEGNQKMLVCQLTGSHFSGVALPCGWSYESSLSKRTSVIDSDKFNKRMIFLRRKDGVDFYLDAITGEERWVERTVRRYADA